MFKTEIVVNSSGNVTCGHCKKSDKVFIRIEWLLLCEKCLNEFIKKIKNKRPST
jgi:hypothetical protein